MLDGEFECSVRALDGLRAGRQISPGDQVEARALGVRHGASIRSAANPVKSVSETYGALGVSLALPGRPANDKDVAFMSLR
jgi:hypothetical protein